jgi:hypothetical protein
MEWAARRHQDLGIDWRVADLFDLPAAWTGRFDLIVEVFTIQSIEPERQPNAAAAIRELLSPGGTLVAVALSYRGEDRPPGPPWALHPSTVDILTEGLDESNRVVEELDDGFDGLLLELTRPDSP